VQAGRQAGAVVCRGSVSGSAVVAGRWHKVVELSIHNTVINNNNNNTHTVTQYTHTMLLVFTHNGNNNTSLNSHNNNNTILINNQ